MSYKKLDNRSHTPHKISIVCFEDQLKWKFLCERKHVGNTVLINQVII